MEIAVTFPALGVTVEIASSDDENAIFWLFASLGLTVALSVAVSPTFKAIVVWSNSTPVTFLGLPIVKVRNLYCLINLHP